MSAEQSVVFVPGLGDQVDRVKLLTKHWRKHDLRPIVFGFGWNDKDIRFKDNFEDFLAFIDSVVAGGKKVSLIGLSAGGSVVMNVFTERKDSIHRVINVCGRLRAGTQKGFRSFETRTASSPAFADSVKLFERRETELAPSDRKRIMTVRAMFGDELVPADTATIDGAVNILVPTPEHVLSIALALTTFSRPLINFVKGP